ncbi:MAG: site-specific integrase [Phycisphaeraceae bacterium]|nr:site-specific integrase [Phycisphaeraceae bacterium]
MKIRPHKKPKQQHSLTPLNDFEVARLLSYVRKQANVARLKGTMRPIVDELIFELLCSAGLRPKEMCELNISDTPVSHNRSIITVRSKNKHRSREIVIPQETDEVIRHFVTIVRTHSEQNDPLLVSERANRFGYASIYNKIRRVGEQVGLPGITPNILRKTYMARLFMQKQDLKFVQQQAGHAHSKTTALCVKRASVFCDACQREISDNQAELIDSGQVLCLKCLKDFRS